MKTKMKMALAALCLISLTGCRTLEKIPEGSSINYSLIKLNLNWAMFKSTATSAEAGETVDQVIDLTANGDGTLSAKPGMFAQQVNPKLNVQAVTPSTRSTNTVVNMNMVPLNLSASIGKSSVLHGGSAVDVTQLVTVDADGDSMLAIAMQKAEAAAKLDAEVRGVEAQSNADIAYFQAQASTTNTILRPSKK